MKLNRLYVTASKSEMPVTIEIKRLSRNDMLGFLANDREDRNEWCQRGKCCGKYGQRPCCPPRVPMFDKLPEKEYMYLVMVKIGIQDYLDCYPKVAESKTRTYFSMDGSHKMTRNIQNRIATSFDGQAFRVGGCLGCRYTKDGVCKRFAPPLEGTGIDVCKLSVDVFGEDVEWTQEYKGDPSMTKMIAIGGVYTNETISKKRLIAAVDEACNIK